ncbi:DNA-protecting protein DprA [Limnobaculum zhutongyuii]|uniref:DNA-protecting protein DprA n=1 Tax=Limnobaculum zhutongyuii TaxID=2498113 RepID=A0A411WPX5_9GAMM|nr:DNA-processing protein DprA [Limnobaculum zhutongyuii]QBH98180.1 DNA-protecting protein DprA [Limnobaculum zhutongyuii]TQS86268.1 DNA-protecting protein DprA [Limnobaculum zhutongyuii]
MERDEWWLRLLMISGKKLPYIRRLRNVEPSQIVFNEQLLPLLGFSRQQVEAFLQVEPHQLIRNLSWLEGEDCHLVTYIDPEYPDLLRNISSAPLALFIRGERSNLAKPQLAIVGSRHYSQYGQIWASYFSQQLAASGLVITSGLAVGIDGISHQGALAAGGITIAVLGSGLARLHPRSHLGLAQKILESQGSLVSEFLPFEAPRAEYFPRRNRIISGLCLGVLVIEAGLRSGSLITAKYALEQGREVFAIPGPLDNRNSEGTHSLIQQGALLVAQPEDIIENLNSSLCWITPLSSESSIEPAPLLFSPDCPLADSPLYEHVSHHPISVDVIADKMSLSVTEVMIQLLELELSGAVQVVQGGYIRTR